MRHLFIVLGLMSLSVVGCKSSTSTASSGRDPSVLDVNRPMPTPEPVASNQPVIYDQPVYSGGNNPSASLTPIPSQPVASVTPSSATGGNTYTVHKGETLFSIAKSKYGSGGEWKKIATANPGMDPNKIKVGQKIILP